MKNEKEVDEYDEDEDENVLKIFDEYEDENDELDDQDEAEEDEEEEDEEGKLQQAIIKGSSDLSLKNNRGAEEGTTSSSIGIRPRPLICKPGKVECKSEPIESKWQWAPGAWQDATRTSAFQPYKPPTLLTNLQRGNTKTEISLPYSGNTFYTLAGQGELTPDSINSGSVDKPDEYGLTGLMWAAGYGQLNSARLLLKAGANKNHQGPEKQTPLHLAAAYGHHDLVKLLLNHGADPNVEEEEGNTPLIYGARGDHPHVCYELLCKGADVAHKNVDNVSAYNVAITNKSQAAKAVIENFLIQQLTQIPFDIF